MFNLADNGTKLEHAYTLISQTEIFLTLRKPHCKVCKAIENHLFRARKN